MDVRINDLFEQLRGYELSAEGLWMFEIEEPVEISLTPEEIINYWKQHAVLAECNNNNLSSV